MKKGNFVLNDERWKAGGMKSTTVEYYDCVDCVKSKTPHEIIEIPGPPAKASQFSHEGDPTTMNKCTGCGAETGPWVPAESTPY